MVKGGDAPEAPKPVEYSKALIPNLGGPNSYLIPSGRWLPVQQQC